MKTFIISNVFLAIYVGVAQAAVVGWGAQETESLGLANGNLAPQGALVRLGYFTISDSQVQTLAAAGNKTGLNAAFQQFDSSTVGTGFSLEGVWSKSSTNGDTQFAGKPIYYWTLDAPTLTAATQWGIFKSPSPSWVFPSDIPFTGSTTIDLNQVPTNSSGLIVGSYGIAAEAPFTGGSNIYKMATLSAVPEPSTATFGVLVALGALFVRRRLSVTS